MEALLYITGQASDLRLMATAATMSMSATTAPPDASSCARTKIQGLQQVGLLIRSVCLMTGCKPMRDPAQCICHTLAGVQFVCKCNAGFAINPEKPDACVEQVVDSLLSRQLQHLTIYLTIYCDNKYRAKNVPCPRQKYLHSLACISLPI